MCICYSLKAEMWFENIYLRFWNLLYSFSDYNIAQTILLNWSVLLRIYVVPATAAVHVVFICLFSFVSPICQSSIENSILFNVS